MKYQQAIERITDKLSSRTPQKLRIKNFRPAAIIIPVFEKNDEAHILLTVRTDTVGHHKGQISCPGGARDPEDNSLQETALRETEEEVGIPMSDVNIIDRLDDFPTISSFQVTPFVATIPYPYPANINRDEVAELLEVPLSLFLNDHSFEMKEREWNGIKYPLYYYYFQNRSIWGVTGHILNRFIDQVFEYNPAPKDLVSTLEKDVQVRNSLIQGIRDKS